MFKFHILAHLDIYYSPFSVGLASTLINTTKSAVILFFAVQIGILIKTLSIF